VRELQPLEPDPHLGTLHTETVEMYRYRFQVRCSRSRQMVDDKLPTLQRWAARWFGRQGGQVGLVRIETTYLTADGCGVVILVPVIWRCPFPLDRALIQAGRVVQWPTPSSLSPSGSAATRTSAPTE
jgi:hypothetical protein